MDMEFEKLKAIIADAMNVDPNEITKDMTFAADLDADSLDLYQILMAVEDEFRIKVDEEKAMQIGTVEEALEMIRNARGEEQ